jgi:DNA-binding transcriptional LysR family regulator
MREADVAIRMFEPDQPDLVKRLLTNVRCHICASKDYLTERGTPKKPIDLLDHMILGYPSSTPQPHAHTDWLFELAGIQKDAAYNVILMNSMYGIAQMTRRGAGVSCLPDFMIDEHDELEVIMSDYEAPPIEVFFVYPEERRNSARIKALRDFLIETLKD